MKRILAPALVVVLAACPEPTPMPDGGMNPAPIVTSITPVTGAIAGGTSVTINGTNFVSGATVNFGSSPAAATFENDRRLIAVTSASSAGVVSVTVTNPGGRASTLANAFTFTGTTTTPITEAILQNPADTTDTSGAATVSVQVIAHVQVPTVTNGTGQGMGLRAQVGFGITVGATPVVADFTWADAVYLGDVDGPASGDKLRDSYSGSVSLPAPTTGAQLIYFLAARFSVDSGQTWTIADRDGSANGVLATQLSRVTVVVASVDWCKLGGETIEAPPTLSLRGSAMGPIVYGQVFKTAVTSQTGAGTGIKGALGYGQAGTDPSTWTWVAATFNTDTGGGQNDEFQARLPNPGNGTYKFAFRFNHADGPWLYCGANGPAIDAFNEAQAGTLTAQPIGVDSCVLQFPPMLTSSEGRQSDFVYGRVFVAGLTEANGAAAGIQGELGYGASSAPPTDPSWSWSAGAFNIDVTGGGEEYRARLTGPAPGTWAYAYRFRVSGGPWTYCDKTGSSDGLQQNELGALTAAPFDVANCVLENTNSLQTVLPNAVTQPYTVLINVPTLTDDAGQGTPLSVQLGTGAPGSVPSTWTNWSAATYTSDVMASDRYSATLTASSSTGSSAVAYRVRVGARAAVYCDLDGSQNGFQQAQAGRLAVANAIIQSCRLSTVSGSPVASGSSLTVTARTLIPGVSGNAGASPNLRVQIGNGPVNDNASTSSLWGWKEATFSADVAGDDEFTLTAFPAYTGGRAVSARASLDGVIWTYCDLNGSDVGGYEVNQQYDVIVTNHTEFRFCNTQFPATADGGSTIYGQIESPGLTPNAATPFIAQLGIGREPEDPGFAWNWKPATFNALSGNNNEYQSALPTDGGVGLRYAFRYSLDGGLWCYGDLNGSQNGFSGGANIGLIE